MANLGRGGVLFIAFAKLWVRRRHVNRHLAQRIDAAPARVIRLELEPHVALVPGKLGLAHGGAVRASGPLLDFPS